MVDTSIQNELYNTLGLLPISQQHQVLEFARTLATPHGVPGSTLLQYSGSIDETELDKMSRAIEDGCEKVDSNEW